ncbi:TMhelix containing protein [Vibrio phage 1.115.B._10N.222.49.B11]|nr:TMhelix containing protein [Vibrio phage 1.115.A._10N.222.49.B11]AUR88597.1 TMhelix containing protein [Vibrio phage 1.115.B._10N.222.49.B11]
MKLKLRPHQEDVLTELRKGWKTNKTHLVYANVGFGKTAVAASIAHGFVSRGLRVMFVAPYTTLVNQTAEKFVEYGLPEPSIIWQKHPSYDPSNPIQIASADTLTRRDMPEVDVLIVDECHIRRKKLLEIIDDADFHTIGLSGTPFAKWMGKHYEQLVKVTTMREMIDNGFLSDFEIYAPTKPDLTGVKTSSLAAFGSDYNEEQVAEIMNGATIVGDIVSNWLKHGEDEPTICFAVNVMHANHLTNEFNRNGVQAEVMTAQTPVDERQMIIKRFEDGITKIICNVGVLVAGFDSDVRCIIYARPTKSEMRWIQCLGRGLRTAPGKKRCLIFDHSGSVHRLGFPDQIEYDELISDNDGMKEAQARKEQEKREKKPKECSKCNYMKPAGVYICPKCGHKPLAGEDVEVDDTRELAQLNGKERQWTKAEKQSWYSMFLCHAQSKGFKDGWVSHKYKEKFGVWPKGLNRAAKAPSPEFNAYMKHLNIKFAKGKAKAQNNKNYPGYYASQQRGLVE